MFRCNFLRLFNTIIAFSVLGLLIVYMQSTYPPLDEHLEINRADGGYVTLSDSSAKIENDDGWSFFSSAASPLSKEEIVSSIDFLNANYEVLNAEKFGPVQEARTVIVVQVHTRIEYLRYLISTLEKATGIEDVLLVFSHDFSSPDINKLIREIQFCMVIQIFYPYNIQLFPNVYPGQDPADCPEKMTKRQASEAKCNNWEHPDKYGHYRVAKLTQIKHHWWWKMNYVFDCIIARYGLKESWVLLLEEDHYVSPDFLHVLNLIVESKKTLCHNCQVISLGFYLKKYDNYETDLSLLGIHPWFSSKHNMGMAIESSTWQMIKNCSKLFCTYDDYNWDWSLMQISIKCLPEKLWVITAKAPRVIHVGDCGVHTHRCGVHNAAEQARELFSKVSKSMFPKSVSVSENSRRMLKPSKENGGWGDLRDHQLCLNNSRLVIMNTIDSNGLAAVDFVNFSGPILAPL